MAWKSIPYWLRGAIISGIPLFLGMLYLIYGLIFIRDLLGFGIWVLIILYFFMPLMVLGTLVGWLIGKKVKK